LLLALMLTGAAHAVSRQTASVRFTTTAPGSVTGVVWKLDYRNPEDPSGKPPAVARTIATFPVGTKFDTGAPVACRASDAELALEGGAACPAQSRVGTGALDVDSGSLVEALVPRIIRNDVTNLSRPGQSILLTEATNTAVHTRTVTRARVSGRTVTTDVPPLPGAPPPDPFLALKRFRLSVAPLTRAGRSYVRTPPTCPRSRTWTSTLVFEYRDGVRTVVKSSSPCVPRHRQGGSTPRPGGGRADDDD
jgi:hypothetical protein